MMWEVLGELLSWCPASPLIPRHFAFFSFFLPKAGPQIEYNIKGRVLFIPMGLFYSA